MSEQVVKKAEILFKRKKFSKVIEMLEPYVIDYHDSFYFFYMLGVSCMYNGDIGGAQDYLRRAEQIKDDDPSLWIAQASLFLRKGDTERAIQNYLDVLEFEPRNKIAKQAMHFIQTKGDIATISQWVANGKIKMFYPDTGVYIPVAPIISVCAVVLIVFLCIFIPSHTKKYRTNRTDLNKLVLSSDERRNSVDPQSGTYANVMTSAEISQAYNNAMSYFEKGRDNAAQVEINRILNSNASSVIRSKASQLMEYMDDPTFDNLKDLYTYEEVAKDVFLYQDCWIIWSGRVSNVKKDDYLYECTFVIGDGSMKKIDGMVPLVIAQPITIDDDRPIKVLAKIGIRDGQIYLKGKTVYQPIVGGL